jgi:hypothetical protein
MFASTPVGVFYHLDRAEPLSGPAMGGKLALFASPWKMASSRCDIEFASIRMKWQDRTERIALGRTDQHLGGDEYGSFVLNAIGVARSSTAAAGFSAGFVADCHTRASTKAPPTGYCGERRPFAKSSADRLARWSLSRRGQRECTTAPTSGSGKEEGCWRGACGANSQNGGDWRSGDRPVHHLASILVHDGSPKTTDRFVS